MHFSCIEGYYNCCLGANTYLADAG